MEGVLSLKGEERPYQKSDIGRRSGVRKQVLQIPGRREDSQAKVPGRACACMCQTRAGSLLGCSGGGRGKGCEVKMEFWGFGSGIREGTDCLSLGAREGLIGQCGISLPFGRTNRSSL